MSPRVLTLLLVVVAGCSRPSDLKAEPSPVVGTVARLSWTTDEPELGGVRWSGEAGVEGQLFEQGEPRTRHELVVGGLLPSQEYRFEVKAQGRWSTRGVQLQTDTLDDGDRRLIVDTKGGEEAFRGFLPLPMIGAAPGILVVNPAGAAVWSWLFEDTDQQPRRVWYQPHHKRFLASTQTSSGEGRILSIPLDGTGVEQYEFPDLHHDFLYLPDGDLLMLVHETRELDGVQVQADRVVKRALDGSAEETVWSAIDQLDPATIAIPEDGDWTHANALDHNPALGLILVGLRNHHTILALDDQDYEQLWALGGMSPDFLIDPASQFRYQHQFELLENNHLLVFDNHNAPPDPEDARVVEYALDLQAGTATEVWRYHHDPPMRTTALGNVDRLNNGNTIITWTTAGEVQVVSPQGEVLWQLNVGIGNGIGYAQRFEHF